MQNLLKKLQKFFFKMVLLELLQNVSTKMTPELYMIVDTTINDRLNQ